MHETQGLRNTEAEQKLRAKCFGGTAAVHSPRGKQGTASDSGKTGQVKMAEKEIKIRSRTEIRSTKTRGGKQVTLATGKSKESFSRQTEGQKDRQQALGSL